MKSFTLRQTTIVKGIAAMLMLFHHLFYYYTPELEGVYYYHITYKGEPLVTYLAILAKVCVAIFLLLSGYGLYESFYRKYHNQNKVRYAIKYTVKHLWKIYSLYWLVFLVFVPISSLFFGRTIRSVYHSKLDFLIDLLGLAKIFHTDTFNTTWWFMSVILVCYLLFPILLLGMKNLPFTFTISISILVFMPQAWFNHSEINIWLYPFVLGMFVSRLNLLDKLGKWANKKNTIIISIGTLLIMMVIATVRPRNEFYLDPYFGLLIIVFSFLVISKIPIINKILEFTGKHSASFFLIHTFVYEVFLYDYIYTLWYPPLIFMMHFIVSLLLSYMIDYLRSFITTIHKKIGVRNVI